MNASEFASRVRRLVNAMQVAALELGDPDGSDPEATAATARSVGLDLADAERRIGEAWDVVARPTVAVDLPPQQEAVILFYGVADIESRLVNAGDSATRLQALADALACLADKLLPRIRQDG